MGKKNQELANKLRHTCILVKQGIHVPLLKKNGSKNGCDPVEQKRM
jgi:hypothetical protein